MEMKQIEETLKNSKPFDPALIPFTCRYALFDQKGNYISGNMSRGEIEKSIQLLFYDSAAELDFYFPVIRSDGYCVVKYDMLSHFASPVLHRLFSKPELLFLIIFLSCFLFIIIERAMKFGKKLNAQLAALTHDIKTPLTLVKGNTELLMEAEMPGDSMELAEIIHRSAEKIEQYTALLMEMATA